MEADLRNESIEFAAAHAESPHCANCLAGDRARPVHEADRAQAPRLRAGEGRDRGLLQVRALGKHWRRLEPIPRQQRAAGRRRPACAAGVVP